MELNQAADFSARYVLRLLRTRQLPGIQLSAEKKERDEFTDSAKQITQALSSREPTNHRRLNKQIQRVSVQLETEQATKLMIVDNY
jgi:hypothetical protein